MLSQQLRIEHELQERVHLDRILTQYELLVVFNRQFFESEKTNVSEDHVQDLVVSISSNRIYRVKNLVEGFEEFFVADAAVEDLFYEDFLVRVLGTHQKIICMGVNCFNNWIECSDAFDALHQ